MLSKAAYTMQELMDILDVSYWRLYNLLTRLIEEGKVEKRRIGRRIYYARRIP